MEQQIKADTQKTFKYATSFWLCLMFNGINVKGHILCYVLGLRMGIKTLQSFHHYALTYCSKCVGILVTWASHLIRHSIQA